MNGFVINDCAIVFGAMPSHDIGSNIAVRKIGGQIVNGVVTGNAMAEVDATDAQEAQAQAEANNLPM